MKIALRTCLLSLLALFYLPAVFADSLVDGVYVSPSDENGLGACQLTISSLAQESKYGDELFSLESSGDGACEWSAIGMSKNFAITAGSVTSGGVQTFVKITFPFGPAGKQVQMIAYDADGTVRNEQLFMQTDQEMYAAE